MASPEFSLTPEETKNHHQEWFEKYSEYFPQNILHWKFPDVVGWFTGDLNPVWKNSKNLINYIVRTPNIAEEQLTAALNHPDKNVVDKTYKTHTLNVNQIIIVLFRYPDSEKELKKIQQKLSRVKDKPWQEKWQRFRELLKF